MNKKWFLMIIFLTGLLWSASSLAPMHGIAREADDSDQGAEESRERDEREYRFFLGIVSADQGWKLLVNEGTGVRITSKTEVLNSREKKQSRNSIKAGQWVYVEGPVNYDGDIEADKIYLLPGYVKRDEMKKYPFIKIAPIP